MKAKRSHPELHGFGDAKAYRLNYDRKIARENIRAGLRYDGTPRRREVRPDLAGVHGSKRKVIRNQERAEKNMAMGLTWRGTERVRRPYQFKISLWELHHEVHSKIVPMLDIEDLGIQSRGIFR